jgi:hypothetical protein
MATKHVQILLEGKGKGKISVCLTKHHAMKTYWGSAGMVPRILYLGTRRYVLLLLASMNRWKRLKERWPAIKKNSLLLLFF